MKQLPCCGKTKLLEELLANLPNLYREEKKKFLFLWRSKSTLWPRGSCYPNLRSLLYNDVLEKTAQPPDLCTKTLLRYAWPWNTSGPWRSASQSYREVYSLKQSIYRHNLNFKASNVTGRQSVYVNLEIKVPVLVCMFKMGMERSVLLSGKGHLTSTSPNWVPRQFCIWLLILHILKYPWHRWLGFSYFKVLRFQR